MDVEIHYGGAADLAAGIRQSLIGTGKVPDHLTTADLAPADEFHIRGRRAALELAERMELNRDSHVIDLGSGFGGPARTASMQLLAFRPAISV